MSLLVLVGAWPAQAFYNPQTGRWLSRDPVEERGGMNLYNYTENASTRFTDKLGLFKWDSSCTDTEKKQ